ncbi:hypothetical protein ALC57_13457, partial [Trachymyrmex cornetzi]
TPPYTRLTVFLRLHIRERSIGLAGWIPLSLSLHCPHLGIFLGFFRYLHTPSVAFCVVRQTSPIG